MPNEVDVFAKLKCPHENFKAQVHVFRLSDSGWFSAEVKIHCEACKESFRFLGLPCGVDLNGATVSADGTKYRGPFINAEYELVDPQPSDAEMRDNTKWAAWVDQQRQIGKIPEFAKIK